MKNASMLLMIFNFIFLYYHSTNWANAEDFGVVSLLLMMLHLLGIAMILSLSKLDKKLKLLYIKKVNALKEMDYNLDKLKKELVFFDLPDIRNDGDLRGVMEEKEVTI